MKKVYISILLFYLFFHILIPYYIMQFYDTLPIYSEFYDVYSIDKVFLLNLLSVLFSIMFIIVLPKATILLESDIKRVNIIYAFVISYNIILIILSGGFSTFLAGKFNGSIFGYLNRIFNYWTIFIILLTSCKEKINLFFVLFSFLFIRTISGSRSGVFSILLAFIYMTGFKNSKVYLSEFKKYLVILVLASPALFIIGTLLRNTPIENIMNLIIGRLSYLESGSLAVSAFDQNSSGLNIFYEKYGIVKQIKLIIDSFFPGNIFEFDVQPNQYFRSAFMGYSLDVSRSHYTSINMTLPVYFYMYFGFVGSILISSLILVSLYVIWIFSWRKNRIVFFVVMISIYGILSYFDFVMIATQMLTIIITSIIILIFDKFNLNYSTPWVIEYKKRRI